MRGQGCGLGSDPSQPRSTMERNEVQKQWPRGKGRTEKPGTAPSERAKATLLRSAVRARRL